MKTVQRIGILFLLLIFLFGTTGLSLLHHTCNSSKENNVTAYPEFFKTSGSSCCEDEFIGYASANQEAFTPDVLSQHLDAAPCCKTTVAFFKLLILTERVEKLTITDVSAHKPLVPVSLNTILPFEQPLLKPAHFQFHSPPLYGKTLVYYLQQLKIPDHPSFA